MGKPFLGVETSPLKYWIFALGNRLNNTNHSACWNMPVAWMYQKNAIHVPHCLFFAFHKGSYVVFQEKTWTLYYKTRLIRMMDVKICFAKDATKKTFPFLLGGWMWLAMEQSERWCQATSCPTPRARLVVSGFLKNICCFKWTAEGSDPILQHSPSFRHGLGIWLGTSRKLEKLIRHTP